VYEKVREIIDQEYVGISLSETGYMECSIAQKSAYVECTSFAHK